ncbi:MAG: helix-turn-helix domain-containing protein [Candidatus Taylorbacteria bacterium]
MTQEEALDILKLGHNVYLTGQAGSGKTHLLNQYIDFLKSHDVAVAVTASTGIAATHMNGVTIHSWSGLGIKNSLNEYDLDTLESRKYLWDRMQATRVLVIDEVSMLHHFRLDLVERIVRSFKRNDEPFGGLQVVLCGDFFQLPPVRGQGEPPVHFIYESEAWKNMKPVVCYLHEQHRQRDEIALRVLNAVRTNTVSEKMRTYLETSKVKPANFKIEPTRLYTHNVDVDRVNAMELEKIEGESKTYDMTSRGKSHIVEVLKKSCLAPEMLSLKKGARVMFVRNNYDAGYVNGTLGVVIGFDETGPIVETYKGAKIIALPETWAIEEEGKTKAEITQVPLRLAWAITVHKSQGMSLDAVEVDLSKSFEKGMGYVALSRVRSFLGLRLLGLNDISLEVNPDVLRFDKTLLEHSEEARRNLDSLEVVEKEEMQKRYLSRIAPPPGEKKKKKISTYDETLALVLAGLSLKEMAKKREVGVGTIIAHLEKLVEEEKLDPHAQLSHLKPERFNKIKDAFHALMDKNSDMRLSPVRDKLGPTYNFEELRLARLFLGI